jgi:acetate kinase
MKILVLNGGSSTLKTQLFDADPEKLPVEAPAPVWEARADWSRDATLAGVRIRNAGGAQIERRQPIREAADVFAPLIEALWTGDAAVIGGPQEVDAIGHRVVHGGKALRESARVTPEVRETIARMAEFAPVHNALELDGIRATDRLFGERIPQFAVFDTAFHSSLEPSAYVYPGPYEWVERGIRRYGFHGISHQYVSRRAAEMLGRDLASLRLVTCHLGNGCSLAAVKNGRSVDTTMGFTPLDGLMMGSRSGSIDPGILVFLLNHRNYTPDQVDDLLNRRSGLKGLSGVSSDMRDVEKAIDLGNTRARLAFDVFVHRLVEWIGAMTAVLGGVDALVFTAGIGENSSRVRSAVARKFGFLGLKLDAAANSACRPDADVAAADSTVRVLVIRTQEDWQIARECARLTTSVEPRPPSPGDRGSPTRSEE